MCFTEAALSWAGYGLIIYILLAALVVLWMAESQG